MDDFEKLNESIKDMEIGHAVLRESIKDLTSAADALEDYINYIKNPIRMALSQNISADIESKANKMNLYLAMAMNKLEALGDYIKGKGE